ESVDGHHIARGRRLALGDLPGDIDEVVVVWSGHGHRWSARAAPAAHCSSIGCIRCALSSLASLPPARGEPEAAAGNLYLLPIPPLSARPPRPARRLTSYAQNDAARPLLRSRQGRTRMNLLLLIVLLVLLVGALPTWPYSAGWGYYPSGGLGLILLILIVLALTRTAP